MLEKFVTSGGPGRWMVFAAVGVIFLLSLWSASRLRLDERITSMMPDKDPMVSRYVFSIERFHIFDAVYVDVEAESDSPAAQNDAIAAADLLYRDLQNSDFFAQINYRITNEYFINLFNLLSSRAPRLLNAADLSVVDSHLDAAAINRRLAAIRRQLIEPSGPFLRAQMQRDPLDLDDIILKKLGGLRAEVAGAQLKDGRVWSSDSRHILIIAYPNFPAVDTVRGEKLVNFLHRARQKALTATGSKVTISFAGTHVATFDNSAAIKRDASRATIALSLGLMLLSVLVFRNWLFIGLIFFPAMFGIAVAAGVMACIDPSISAVALGCGTILVGIAVDYGVPILYHIDNAPATGDGYRRLIQKLRLPLIMGAATTIAGFLGLLTLALPGQRQMGLFAILGILGALLFAILALRYFIPGRLRFVHQPLLPLVTFCCRFSEWRTRHGRAILLVGIGVLCLGLYGITKVRFEGDVSRLSHTSPETQRDEKRLLAAWGISSPSLVIVQGNSVEGALIENDRLFQVLGELRQEGTIEKISSLAPILPSTRMQAQNLQRWKSFWSPDRRAMTKANLDQGAAEFRFSPGAFDPFFEHLEQEPPPITRADFHGTALQQLLENKIVTQGSVTYILSSFALADRNLLAEVSRKISAAVPGAMVLDKREFVEHMTSMVQNEFQKLVLVAFAAIVLGLYLCFGRIELVLANILPLMVSVFITLGVLGIWDIPLNLMSILFVVFIFGVGVDFSIFLLSSFLDGYRGNRDPEWSSVWCGSVIICALTTMGGFITVALAKHTALFSIGATGLIAMISSLAASLVIVAVCAGRLFPHEGRYGTPSVKTLLGGIWAAAYLVGAALIYRWLLRQPVKLWFRKDSEARQKFTRKYIQRVAQGLFRYFPYLDSKRIYLEAQPEKFLKPAVIVSNHLSGSDIMLVLALPVEMVMVIKRWVWEAPFIGLLVRDAGYLLAADSGADEVMASGKKYLEQGVSVMVFPEGSRSPDGKMHRFHVGAFKLAMETGRDILPILISNSQACIPYKAYWVGDHQVIVRVLPRVTADDTAFSQGPRELSKYVKKTLLAQADQDWRLSQDGKTFWHNIRSRYNYRGAFVENYIAWKLRLDPIYRKIDELVPREGTVLDLGSGYGLMSVILAQKSRLRQVYGLDLDERKIRVCREIARSLDNLQFRAENFMEQPLPSADAIVMVDTLHYWSRDQQVDAIAQACAALNRHGTLVFREACQSNSWRHRLTHWGECFSVSTGHNRQGTELCFLSRESYVEAFSQHGLRLVSEPKGLGRGSNTVLVFKKES